MFRLLPSGEKAEKTVLTPGQREKLYELFGEKGAAIVISHIDELDETFGSGAAVIRLILRDAKQEEEEKNAKGN